MHSKVFGAIKAPSSIVYSDADEHAINQDIIPLSIASHVRIAVADGQLPDDKIGFKCDATDAQKRAALESIRLSLALLDISPSIDFGDRDVLVFSSLLTIDEMGRLSRALVDVPRADRSSTAIGDITYYLSRAAVTSREVPTSMLIEMFFRSAVVRSDLAEFAEHLGELVKIAEVKMGDVGDGFCVPQRMMSFRAIAMGLYMQYIDHADRSVFLQFLTDEEQTLISRIDDAVHFYPSARNRLTEVESALAKSRERERQHMARIAELERLCGEQGRALAAEAAKPRCDLGEHEALRRKIARNEAVIDEQRVENKRLAKALAKKG